MIPLLGGDVSRCGSFWPLSSLLFPSSSRSLRPAVFSWPRRLDSVSEKPSAVIFGKLAAGFSLSTCRILGTGSGFSPSRLLGYSLATGSALFSLGYAWKITVPACIGVNLGTFQGGFSPSSLPVMSFSVALVVDWYPGFWVSVGPKVYG